VNEEEGSRVIAGMVTMHASQYRRVGRVKT